MVLHHLHQLFCMGRNTPCPTRDVQFDHVPHMINLILSVDKKNVNVANRCELDLLTSDLVLNSDLVLTVFEVIEVFKVFDLLTF
jgi:hypothetical protein